MSERDPFDVESMTVEQLRAEVRLSRKSIERLLDALSRADAKDRICNHGSCMEPAVVVDGIEARCEEHRDE